MRPNSAFILALGFSFLFVGTGPLSLKADIYQWEYINPANPSQGKQQSTTLAPDGAGLAPEPGLYAPSQDLTQAYLIGYDLAAATLRFATLTNADLGGANLTDANFFYAGLTNADLSGANLTDASLFNAGLTGANLTNAVIRGVNFGPTTMTGFTAAQLYSTASYQTGDLTGINFGTDNSPSNDLTGWNFAGQNLTDAAFYQARLAGANFSNAEIRGASFSSTTTFGFTSAQLYSTASYQTGDLAGINLGTNDLTGWNFTGQNLIGAHFSSAVLTNTDFSGADSRAAWSFHPNGLSVTDNLIHPDGHVEGLQITAGEVMRLRDYNGSISIPILVEDAMSINPTGTLRTTFDDVDWGSTISFDPGISVSLNGTLELLIAPNENTNITSLIGTTFDLFDWTGVTPSGTFAQITTLDGLVWDTSSLYTTGDVTLLDVPGYLFGDFDNDGDADGSDFLAWQRGFGTTSGATGANGDADADGDVDHADLETWQTRVGTAIVTAPGDFDFDGDVDGTDFLTWQRGFGTVYNASDLADWQANFGDGTPLPASSAAVPEPSTLLLTVAGLLALATNRRHRVGSAMRTI